MKHCSVCLSEKTKSEYFDYLHRKFFLCLNCDQEYLRLHYNPHSLNEVIHYRCTLSQNKYLVGWKYGWQGMSIRSPWTYIHGAFQLEPLAEMKKFIFPSVLEPAEFHEIYQMLLKYKNFS